MKVDYLVMDRGKQMIYVCLFSNKPLSIGVDLLRPTHRWGDITIYHLIGLHSLSKLLSKHITAGDGLGN